MNKTIVIFFGLVLLLQAAITRTAATAQDPASSRRNVSPGQIIDIFTEPDLEVPVVENQLKLSTAGPNDLDEDPEELPDENPDEELLEEKPVEQEKPNQFVDEDEEYFTPRVVNSFSPRDVLDRSTTGRVPETTSESPLVAQADAHTFKQVQIAGDQFGHRTIPFEEPLHERFGIAHSPLPQVTKSSLVFFGKSLFLPANLLPRRHHERDFDSNEGWRERQGRQTFQRCEQGCE